MQKASKKNWTITSDAFQGLLDWLDEGANSDGQKYLEMRRRLVAYFDRKNCLTPDEYADETLNRVARRLEEEGEIECEAPAKYCYTVARFVFMEHLRRLEKANVPLEDALRQTEFKQSATALKDEERAAREKQFDCLEHCAAKLEPANRDLIIGYYMGAERVKIENRRALAEKFGISPNALSIRACRIREKLEACIGKCVEEA